MKNKVFLTIATCFLFYCSFSQNKTVVQLNHGKSSRTDSTLIKVVKGIDQVLRSRYKTKFETHRDFVIIDKEGKVEIDSLYKYDFNSFKEITISFNESPAIYGKQTILGIIKLYRK